MAILLNVWIVLVRGVALVKRLCASCVSGLLAELGEDRGCSTKTSVINSFIQSLILSRIYLRRHHALMVDDGAFSQK